ncbi:MAG: glycosyltransferase [Desulfobacteraceae bacterium]|nr:glycosyltransferase [Desulfobacteraceae bacterium]
MPEPRKIWITWEKQRRSLELARALGCDLYIFDFDGILRYPRCIYNTVRVLISSSAKIVFVQNPSMVLAATACIFRLVSERKVIVDRHTTFRLNKQRKASLDWFIFDVLNNFTIEFAHLTIVTNKYLARVVRKKHGSPYVLPDKLPDLVKTQHVQLEGEFNIFMISSFGKDEPVAEAINAAGKLKEQGVRLYISGNANKLDAATKDEAPDNVVFTGFLSEQDFVNHVYSADAVMALTTADHCMLCGCYEAVAARRPLITTDKLALKEYFSGSIFVDNTSEGISYGIKSMILFYDYYLNNVFVLNNRISAEWSLKYEDLQARLADFVFSGE